MWVNPQSQGELLVTSLEIGNRKLSYPPITKPLHTWVKICGITRLEDASFIEKLGADAIGFVFAASPRRVDMERAAHISQNVRSVQKVGVFVNPTLDKVRDTRDKCSLDIVQLHGAESPEFCKAVGGKVIKAFRLRDEETISRIAHYAGVWKVLVDAYMPAKLGGTGKQIDKDILKEMQDFSNVIIAGGLSPNNVEGIIGEFRPFGIDVSSGVEQSPGIKDHQKLKRLFEIM